MKIFIMSVLFLREFVALLLWTYAVIKLFFFDIDRVVVMQIAPNHVWLLNFKALIILLLFTVLVYLRKSPVVIALTAYVIFYPFVVVFWKIPKWPGLHWPIAIAFAPAIYGFVSAFRFNLTLVSVVIVSAFVILFFQGDVIIIANTTILLSLLVYLWTSLKRSYSATVFSGLRKLLLKAHPHIRSGAMGNVFTRGSSVNQAAATNDALAQKQATPPFDNSMIIYISTWSLGFSAEKVKEVATRNFIDLFLAFSFLFNLAVIVFGFAFIYLGLYKIDASSFGHVSGANYWSFAGYSFTTFTTASVSKITAESLVAQILSYSELVFFLIASFVFVITTFTTSREKYRKDLEEFVSGLQTTVDVVADRLNRELKLTLEELEDEVLHRNVKLVNSLRGFSGKPPLESPTSLPNITNS